MYLILILKHFPPLYSSMFLYFNLENYRSHVYVVTSYIDKIAIKYRHYCNAIIGLSIHIITTSNNTV